MIYKSKIIDGVYIIKSSIYTDKRGIIWTSFDNKELHKKINYKLNFNHDKFSISKKNVLRGIHFDTKTWKLISCIKGAIYQVLTDCRLKSKTYKKTQYFLLKEYENIQLLAPPGIGNAFLVQSDYAIYHYKLSYKGKYFDANNQKTIKWNDKNYNIKWPTKNPILSNRDN